MFSSMSSRLNVKELMGIESFLNHKQTNKQANSLILGAGEEWEDTFIREPKLEREDPLRRENGRKDPSPHSGNVRSTVLISSHLRERRGFLGRRGCYDIMY